MQAALASFGNSFGRKRVVEDKKVEESAESDADKNMEHVPASKFMKQFYDDPREEWEKREMGEPNGLRLGEAYRERQKIALRGTPI